MESKMARISFIAAIGKNRELGNNNKLLWHIPADWKHFQATTTGHPVIMGRKTFESIGKPLPKRPNIVITRNPGWKHEGVLVVSSAEEALTKARELDTEEIFIVGGAQIYEEMLPKADRLYLTLVDTEGEADAFFPSYEKIFTKKISEKSGKQNELKYRFVVLEK
jgi:dihydrofolate reductase